MQHWRPVWPPVRSLQHPVVHTQSSIHRTSDFPGCYWRRNGLPPKISLQQETFQRTCIHVWHESLLDSNRWWGPALEILHFLLKRTRHFRRLFERRIVTKVNVCELQWKTLRNCCLRSAVSWAQQHRRICIVSDLIFLLDLQTDFQSVL